MKGEKMPQTPEQFARMGDLYEKALLAKDAEISSLKHRINQLQQKVKNDIHSPRNTR